MVERRLSKKALWHRNKPDSEAGWADQKGQRWLYSGEAIQCAFTIKWDFRGDSRNLGLRAKRKVKS